MGTPDGWNRQAMARRATEDVLLIAGFGGKVDVRNFNNPPHDGEIVVFRPGTRDELAAETILDDDTPRALAARILAKVQSSDPAAFGE